MQSTPRIVIVGGGAAGYFGAIHAAEHGATVTICEASKAPLAKVRVAGGGRCNITNHCFNPAEFATRYPRGTRELRAAFGHFQARDLMDWFEDRGVQLHHEADGRVFPRTNDSATIAEALIREATRQHITLRTSCPVRSIQKHTEGFTVRCKDAEFEADRVLLASGGARQAMELAGKLGHSIEPPVPALFTLRSQDPVIKDLSGVAHQAAVQIVPQGASKPFKADGPVLITHWGLSGPAILKSSSWAARALADVSWQGVVTINWCPEIAEHDLRAELRQRRAVNAKQLVQTQPSQGIPKRLWERLVARADLEGTWAQCSNGDVERLLGCLQHCDLTITGKGPFSEEFVVCGGIKRKEIDWRRMESRIQPGLHFAGEVIDQDGLTGGFNLQAAWTTGWIAGTSMALGFEGA